MSMEDILPIARAFEKYRHHYDNGGADFSVTEIINPPRISVLQKRHWPEILQEPLEIRKYLDGFDGTAKHMLMQSLLRDDPEFICEERLYIDVLGKKISGCPDLIYLPTSILYDYKNCKVWKRIFGDIEHWEQQLNIYAGMIHVNSGKAIAKIIVAAWFKDWAEENVSSRNYPPEPIEGMQIPLWSAEKQMKFLLDRVALTVDAMGLPDNQLPECTPEDMWSRGQGWAAMPYRTKPRKRGFKAGRVLPTMKQIEAWIEANPPSHGNEWVIEERKGTRMRCEKYCDVAPYCNQYKEWKSGKKT